MTKLISKFGLRSENPMQGGQSGYWITVQPTEVATAYLAGVGPGVPNDLGTVQAGTISAGQIGVLNTVGTFDLATSPLLNAAQPILPFIVFEGDDDYSGMATGTLIAVHGPGRLDTEKFDVGVYTPGLNLIASAATAGNFAPKVGADHRQIIATVGPRGLLNGVLDVIAVQGMCGYVD